ncbi:MAG: hypothetical protein JWO02_4453 [Solirubrobacterales bacterium]|nr:hypothetical protein [Solirubrobacterales bacterium]
MLPTEYGTHPAPGYGRLLPNAPNLHPSHFEMWFFLAWAGALVVVVAIPWAIIEFRKGHRMPALTLAGGLLCSIQEPMWDHLGHLRWATALPDAFHNFGLDVPVLIPPCYMLFFGLEVYFIYTLVNRGITRKDFFLLFVACGITDAIMEHPGLLMGIYEYYGNDGPQPFDFGNKFPFYWSIINSAGFMTGGVIATYVYPQLKGKGWKELGMLVVPPVGMAMGYGACAWPVFLAINADISWEVQWILGGGGCVALAWAYIYTLGGLVGVEASERDWTLWDMFKARFMLPGARERFYAGTEKGAPVTSASSN